MKQTYAPRTELGLAIPPTPMTAEEVDKITAPEDRRCLVSRHHLYWPREVFGATKLSKRFREHRFNSVWLPDPQHVEVHKHFLGAEVPDVKLMKKFMREAMILDQMDVSVQAVDVISEAVRGNRIRSERLLRLT